MKSLIERFLDVTRNISSNPKMCESETNINLFEKFSVGLFNTKLIEIYSSNVFPETIKFKNGEQVLLWDSSYWSIFHNIIIMYFMAIDAETPDLCEWIKQRLEAEIYYFMSLKTWDETKLSVEFSRSYRELINKEVQVQTTIEQMEFYSKNVYEVVFIAKIFCLFHELNHMENFKQSEDFSSKLDTLMELFGIASQLLQDDVNFFRQLREHYSDEKINDALLQVIEHKNSDFEVELTCDLAALYDTVDFFENVWTDSPEETIFSKVNEVLIVFNSINFALTQTYRFWHFNYQFFCDKISAEKLHLKTEHANQESVLRYVLSDITKSMCVYSLYGEKMEEILNTDQYGLRFQAENAFIEDVANFINSKECLEKMYTNISNYKNVSEEKLESLRNTLLDWQ